MRFVTYAGDDGDRVGVLDGDHVYALAPGTRLIDLLDDQERLLDTGDRALRDPHAVHAAGSVRLRAPIPSPPTIRDFMTFERHVEGVAKLRSRDAQVPDQWYTVPLPTSPTPTRSTDRTTTRSFRPAAPCSTSNSKSP
ncbi:hypothetical protein [Amycolatopsis sp. NPDC021455]|uniref:hypothetical protein n=1 Tax=Amycolatopsis sp. NPDC021455 TaxID=3154901 RepID=UPI0033EDA228